MLHVRMLSGQEMTRMPAKQASSVRGVKRRLQEVHGLPPRFRQRLIFGGASLADDDKLLASATGALFSSFFWGGGGGGAGGRFRVV